MPEHWIVAATLRHIILILERAFDEMKLTSSDHHPIAIIEIGCDDDVSEASLVIHRNADVSLGRTCPTRNDAARRRGQLRHRGGYVAPRRK